jgi:hypothetical protein
MSGRPYTYSRGMAIAQLMIDQRRPAIKAAGKNLRQVFLYGEDLFVSYFDTIDWVPKLSKLTRYGRCEDMIVEGKPEIEGQPYTQWGTMIIEPIEGWPTEKEIAACITESAERQKDGGSLSTNDITAFKRLRG